GATATGSVTPGLAPFELVSTKSRACQRVTGNKPMQKNLSAKWRDFSSRLLYILGTTSQVPAGLRPPPALAARQNLKGSSPHPWNRQRNMKYLLRWNPDSLLSHRSPRPVAWGERSGVTASSSPKLLLDAPAQSN